MTKKYLKKDDRDEIKRLLKILLTFIKGKKQ